MTHPLPGLDDSATRCLAVPIRDHGRPFAFWRVGNGKRAYMKDRRDFHLTGWFDLYKVARPGGFAGEPPAVHACGLSAARPPAALAGSRFSSLFSRRRPGFESSQRRDGKRLARPGGFEPPTLRFVGGLKLLIYLSFRVVTYTECAAKAPGFLQPTQPPRNQIRLLCSLWNPSPIFAIARITGSSLSIMAISRNMGFRLHPHSPAKPECQFDTN
jgi:hypothetical protein